jgi:hypothetical protein
VACALFEPARRVTKWREEHVLVLVYAERMGRSLTLSMSSCERRSSGRTFDVLREHGMDHLSIAQIRSKNRAVTQAISRDLYEHGAAGVTFKSNLDGGRCLVLFERRG